ncbi:MAG: ACP S-malonyltransferase [Planctomycetota bacterium]
MTHRAVLFPGQGAQFVGMHADLVARCPETEAMFSAASRLLGRDLYALVREGPSEVLDSTAVSQPAIFVVSLAVTRAIAQIGGEPALHAMGTAGLSLGEYSALVFSGAVPFAAALEVVVRRGEYMQEACDRHPSGMSSILGLDFGAVREVVALASASGVVAISNVNADQQIVVSGELGALERAAQLALERGARKVVPLKVAGAYHSPLMASATGKLLPFLERLEIRPPRVPFYPNVTAEATRDPEVIRAGLIRQIESAVLWAPTLRALVADGMQSALEPGPGRVVAGLVKQVERTIPVHSVLDEASVTQYAASL